MCILGKDYCILIILVLIIMVCVCVWGTLVFLFSLSFKFLYRTLTVCILSSCLQDRILADAVEKFNGKNWKRIGVYLAGLDFILFTYIALICFWSCNCFMTKFKTWHGYKEKSLWKICVFFFFVLVMSELGGNC